MACLRTPSVRARVFSGGLRRHAFAFCACTGEDVFKFFDEGANRCSDFFTSEGGVANSVAATSVPVTISSCTDSRADFDQVDTVGRLQYLALGFAAFGVLCMLSVTVLSIQDTGADLWLAGVYTAFTNVLACT